MTVDQALNLAGILKGIMRGMTEDDRRTVAKELLEHELEPAQAAIDQYTKSAIVFNMADFVRCLTGRPAPTAAERAAEMLHRDRDMRRSIETEHTQLERSLELLSDEELARHREEVLAELKVTAPAQAELLGNVSVRKSVTLRRLIARRLAETKAMTTSAGGER